ncbi:hypothetical protein MRB53_037143 [Persea americana]|nr:hypothetical protein MRB53_037143 [Persea americana]
MLAPRRRPFKDLRMTGLREVRGQSSSFPGTATARRTGRADITRFRRKGPEVNKVMTYEYYALHERKVDYKVARATEAWRLGLQGVAVHVDYDSSEIENAIMACY